MIEKFKSEIYWGWSVLGSCLLKRFSSLVWILLKRPVQMGLTDFKSWSMEVYDKESQMEITDGNHRQNMPHET